MATLIAALTDPSIVLAGIDPALTGTSAGHTFWNIPQSFQVDLACAFSGMEILCIPGTTQPFVVTVDGVPVTPTLTTGAWGYQSIFSGTDIAHTVTIKYNQTCPVDALATLRFTGANPVLTQPSGLGFAHVLKTASVGGAAYLQVDPTFGTSQVAGTGGQGTPEVLSIEGDCTFGLKSIGGTDLMVYGQFSAAFKFELQIDGIAQPALTVLSGSAAWRWLNLFSGLSGNHLYRVSQVGGMGTNTIFTNVAVLGGTVDTTPLAARTRSFWYNGDSITNVTVVLGSNGETREGNAHLTGLALDVAVSTHGTNGAPTPTVNQVSSFALRPTDIVLQWGTNDAGASHTVLATFQSNYLAYLTSLRAANPSARIWCMSILLRGDGVDVGPYNLRILAAIASFADANTRYVSRDTWILTTTADLNADLLHPISTGYTKISRKERPYFNSNAAYTITGPATGVVGNASADFTVTVAGGGLFDGTETVTLSDGGLGGTFTPSVGSPGVGTVTVTPANDASSFTYKYTPATTGPKTFTASNAQAWNNPGPVSFTASSAVTTTRFGGGGTQQRAAQARIPLGKLVAPDSGADLPDARFAGPSSDFDVVTVLLVITGSPTSLKVAPRYRDPGSGTQGRDASQEVQISSPAGNGFVTFNAHQGWDTAVELTDLQGGTAPSVAMFGQYARSVTV